MNSQKLILQMLCKYAEMVNSHLADLTHRIKILEDVMLKNPDLIAQYQQSARDTKRADVPGLPRQLSALQQEVSRLRE